MKARCTNPNSTSYADYGGRGIKVCDRWLGSFEAFAADMGERPSSQHTIERRDTNGHYEPNNCEWATRTQQANNKRNNRLLAISGTTKTLAQWAAQAGVSEATIRARIARGVTGAHLLAPDPRAGSLTFRGEKRTLAEWAQITGIKKRTLSSRIYVYRWPLDRALTEGATL